MVNKRKLLTLASQPSITKLIKKKLSFKVVIILFIVILLEELLFGVIQKIFKRDNERPQPYFIDCKFMTSRIRFSLEASLAWSTSVWS